MTLVFTVLAAILIFAILVFIHEFGHFITAKLTGVKVLEFALGMGPKIFSFKKGETLYSLRAFPIGGFCSMEGEDGEKTSERSMWNKPAPIRLLVLASGAFMNILLGFILLVILISGQKVHLAKEVDMVVYGSAAYESGILAGDEIIKINSKKIHIGQDVSYICSQITDGDVQFLVKRNGEQINVNVAKKANEPYGIKLATRENTVKSVLSQSYYQTIFYSKVIINSLVDLIKGRVPVTEMSGPIGIVSEIGNAVEEGITAGESGIFRLLSLTILLTVNLGIFNLLPIPALDGGRIFFVLVEMIIRKRLPPEKEGMVHFIGFLLLMLLAVFIAYMDVLKIFR